METKIKISGLIIGIILFIALIAGLSYAYYNSLATNTSTVKGTAGCFVVDHVKGNDVSGDVILFDESKIITNNNITIKNGMQLTYVTAGINDACTIDGYITINMNIKTLNTAFTSGNSKGAFKYAIAKYSPSTYTSPSISTLNNKSFKIIKTASITTTGEQTILTSQLPHSTQDSYLIIFYIDGDLANNDAGNTTFSATISATASQGNAPEKASTLITNLYNDSTKTDVVNNSITYKYDTTHNLMQDTAGNIRYYGASPNNYVYFNCESYPSTNCELWRIIGVFDGKIKLMRNSIIGSYSWDTSASTVNSGYGVNEWSQADIMKLLNPGYESESVGGSLYYNSKSGTCYNAQKNGNVSCNFTTTGIKNDTTRNLIAETTYNIGGYNTSGVYSNVMYEKERGTTVISNPSDGITRTTSWTGKIALPYPSDYGYATDLSKCSQTLYNYDSSTDSYACRTNDWMYPILGTSSYGWLLTPYSSYADNAFGVRSSGYVSSNCNVYLADGVAPVLYLSSDQDIVSGDGSQSNPYQLANS